MSRAPAETRFGADVALLVAARLASVAAFFGVTVVGARFLSAEELGSAAAGQTIGMIAALVANGGLNIATIYFLQQRPAERPAIVPGLVFLGISASALAAVLILVSAPILLGLVVSADGWPLLVGAAAMGATMVAFEVTGALLLGLGFPRAYTLMELVRGVGSLAAVAVLLAGPWRAGGGFVLGLAVGYAAASLLGLVRTKRSGMPLRPRLDPELSSAALAFGVRGQIGNVFQFLGVRLDLLIVPALLDLRAAGIYFVAVRMSDVVGQAATAASSLIFPRVAAQEDRTSTLLTERATRLILLVVAASSVVLGLVADLVLRVAFGPVYASGTAALLILLVAMLPLSAGRVLAADLKGRGRPGLVSAAALLSVVATVAFDLALIPGLGIVGAAVASLLAYSVTTVALLLAYRSVSGGRFSALLPRPSDARDLLGATRRTLNRAVGRQAA